MLDTILPTLLDLQAVLVPALACAGILVATLGYLTFRHEQPPFRPWWF